MCDILSAERFLAFLLQKRPEVSFQEIRDFRDKIEARVPNIIVDVSVPAIDLAITYYPHVFVQRGGHIARSREDLDPKYIDVEFLAEVPPKVTRELERALKSA